MTPTSYQEVTTNVLILRHVPVQATKNISSNLRSDHNAIILNLVPNKPGQGTDGVPRRFGTSFI